jgi:zona occludens toxin (predicted ATPase)
LLKQVKDKIAVPYKNHYGIDQLAQKMVQHNAQVTAVEEDQKEKQNRKLSKSGTMAEKQDGKHREPLMTQRCQHATCRVQVYLNLTK